MRKLFLPIITVMLSRMHFRKVCLFLALLGFAIVSIATFSYWQRPLLVNKMSFSKAAYSEQNELLKLTLSSDEKYRLWVPLEQISMHMQTATLEYEDRHFYSHYGIDIGAMLRSVWHSFVLRDRRMGGSTIPMQLARMRFGINSKSFNGKVLQILRALQLEVFYSKQQILEAYLNLAPYGANIEGVGAASLIYFGQPADQLSENQSRLLSRVPQNPIKRAAPLLLVSSPRGLPNYAPHFVNQAILSNKNSNTYQTSLDLRYQDLIEKQVADYIRRNTKNGVYNAAVILLDSRTMEVLAQLGSADFSNVHIQGQVDGTRAKRSPGSALKPFIYGLAIDQGLIHSKSLLKDTPLGYASYAPENFEGDFVGPILAEEALIRSRNLPAIDLSNRLGDPSLWQFLKNAEIGDLKSEGHYGLALALGGVGVTLQELVELYAMLNNGGEFRHLKLLRNNSSSPSRQLLSPEAAFVVLEMLRANKLENAQDLWGGDVNKTKTKSVAWKTGTSFGFKDAWTIGVKGPYVLGVWVGNFDGTPNPAFVGRSIAAPLFFELFNALEAKFGLDDSFFVKRQLKLKQVEVCGISGMLPSENCSGQKIKAWFLPGKSPIETCNVHRRLQGQVVEVWSSDIQKLFSLAGLPRKVTFQNLKSASVGSHLAPEIISPYKAVAYTIRADDLAHKRPSSLPLVAVSDGVAQSVSWFVNGAYLGKARSGETLFWDAQPGHHLIQAVDELGLSSQRNVEVVVGQ